MENEETNLKVIKIEIIAIPQSSQELEFQTGEGLEHGCRLDSGAEEVCVKISQDEEIHRGYPTDSLKVECSKDGRTGVDDAIETKAQPTEEADEQTITFLKVKKEPLDIDYTQYTEDEDTKPQTRSKSKDIRKNSGVEPFQCSLCDKRLSCKGNLSKHLRAMHCQCSVCNQTFSDEETLSRHLTTHSKPKSYQCTLCLNKFISKGNLSKHLRTIHCQCSACNKVFSSEDILAKHITTHSRPKLYQCTLCLNNFMSKGNLNKHLRSIHHQCSVCNEVFSSKDIFARHVRTHPGRKAYRKRPRSQAELRTQSDISVNERFISENGSSHLANHVSSFQGQCGNEKDIGESASSQQKHGEINTDIKRECDEKHETASIQDIGQSSYYATTQNNQYKPQGKHAGEELFLCSICNKEFSSRGNLNKHLKMMHFQCPVCNQMFPREDVLLRHMETHQRDKPYQCALCINKVFTTTTNLNKHIKRLAHPGEEKPICQCSYCSKLFSNGDTLSRHVRMHHECKSYQCSVCSKAFSNNRSRKVHMRTHSGEKPYQCKICKKAFSHTSSLNVHMRRHTGEKPYKCTVCDEEFTHRNSLATHKNTHTGEHPYRCTICSKGFMYRNSLVAHMKAHKGEKPHQCSVCGIGFAHAYDLSLHTRTHTGEKPYVCSFCSKSFVTKDQLTLHARIHTGEMPFQCPVCSKCFPRNGTLMEHMKVHTGEKPYYCPICSRGLSRKYDVIRHLKLHIAEKPLKCGPHHGRPSVDIHAGGNSGKSLMCSVCSREFSRKCDLKRHYTRLHTY